jgi:exodeoxyribonuclease VII small subunit
VPKERFEDALEKLEKIVSKLEGGEISLEESLKLFEEGIRLSRFCSQKLEEAEKKVEILLRDKEGQWKTEPFEPLASPGQVSRESSTQDPSGDEGGPSEDE